MEPIEEKKQPPIEVKIVTAVIFLSIPALALALGYKHMQVKLLSARLEELTNK